MASNTVINNALQYHTRDLVLARGTTGNVFFVDSGASGAGDSTDKGKTKENPFSTIDYAVGQCTANNGDIIYVMPGHAETVSAAAGLDLDVAGIRVVGIGHGTDKPTITLDTATTADVDIDATNIQIENLRFVSDINSLAVILDVNQGNFACYDCDFVSSSAKEVVNFVNIATTKDDFHFERCTFYQPTDPEGTDDAAATGCFYIVDSENIVVKDCRMVGFFETSIFHNKTTKVQGLFILNCYGQQELSGADVITLVDASEGFMRGCSWNCPNVTDTAEGSFMTIAATTPFGFFHNGFANDNGAGGNLALEITAANA